MRVAKSMPGHKGNVNQMTLRFHFTPVSRAVIKKQAGPHAGEDVGKETLIHCWWECKLVQSLWKSIWRFLRKLKINYPI
jgi:hypothetical protein